MAIDGTYTGLAATLVNFLHRSDLVAKIPDYVTLAEAEMNRAINVRRQISRSMATISTEFANLPADFSGIRTFRLTTGTNPELFNISPEQMADKKDRNPTVGQPQYYSITGQEFEFYPVPDGDYTAMISYYQGLPGLVANGTNWLIVTYPDVYVKGALKYAFTDIKDDDRAAAADSQFQAAMGAVNDQSIFESFGGSLQSSPSGMVI